MALLVIFTGPRELADVYDRVIDELDSRGHGAPPGRESHVAAIDDAGISVVDVWSTQEQLDAFTPHLVGILEEIGAPPPDVVARPIHHRIPGEA